MPKYIDADKFLESEVKRCGCEPVIGTCTNDNKPLKDVINEFPTAEVQKVRHGYWICKYLGYGAHVYECSCCGGRFGEDEILEWKHDKFCADCGAKMK